MTSIVSSTITDSVEVSSPRWEQPFKNQVKPQAWSRLSIPVSLSDLELFEGIDSMHGSLHCKVHLTTTSSLKHHPQMPPQDQYLPFLWY